MLSTRRGGPTEAFTAEHAEHTEHTENAENGTRSLMRLSDLCALCGKMFEIEVQQKLSPSRGGVVNSSPDTALPRGGKMLEATVWPAWQTGGFAPQLSLKINSSKGVRNRLSHACNRASSGLLNRGLSFGGRLGVRAWQERSLRSGSLGQGRGRRAGVGT